MVALGKKSVITSGRTRRVIVYTASLIIAPLPVMPYVKGTREYAFALVACGVILSLSSLYVARGELKLKARGLLGMKLLAASLITLLFGMSLVVGSLIYLSQSQSLLD
ncbi:MAG TPA: hypothetical protein VGW12_07430 [Pyrinomonadaceae bacterium]|nr:hypothetical protein [Pyrinomonadaceae bacterium]